MPPEIRKERLDKLCDGQIDALRYQWSWWGRPAQFAPQWDWNYWLIMAGRGFGKTRCGAEWVRQQVKTSKLVNLIGATVDDARDIMIEGESGILAICPPDERPTYISHKRRLEWPNGARSLIFTADEPERLRGKQHMKLWCDEVCAWRYQESWDQAMFGLRLGRLPQAVVTTTPKPIKMLKDLLADERTALTTGSTYDNQDNLAPTFLHKIIARYEGTRLGRQELLAEVLEDTPGALWKRSRIDELRVKEVPRLRRVVVAIDPAVSTKEGSDETGIIVAGLGFDDHIYVLADLSGNYTPDEWATEAIRQFDKWKADRIIAEVNNGGDMVEAAIRTKRKSISYKAVHASRGKVIRAEPVSALYEQGKAHHVGAFAILEDQMCVFTTDYDRTKMGYSPDRLDALVWAATELGLLALPGAGLLEYIEEQNRKARRP